MLCVLCVETLPDFKMPAAAFLFSVTGNPAYEDAVAAESVVTTANSEIDLSCFGAAPKNT